MRFSSRLPRELRQNALAALLDAKRAAGAHIIDLTESNPTQAGIDYPAGYLSSLASASAARYEPEPFGLRSARDLIAGEYGAPAERVILTASTSEAYSWLFKLLCDPGDRVLVPRPSYPLFDYLAALESVDVRHYNLFYDHGWFIDFHTIERALDAHTRAIVIVNPNNPTGHFVRRHELAQLTGYGLPIISDEVFRDYPINPAADSLTTLQNAEGATVFTLNGLSKSAGLPQMKLAWMIASGPVDEALARLEIIADTYLSVGTPVQTALAALLAVREPVTRQILARLRANLAALQASGLRTLDVEAGWYAIVRTAQGDESPEIRLLNERDVLVQPGYFYDFEDPGYIVISLLTPPADFREGIGRLLPG